MFAQKFSSRVLIIAFVLVAISFTSVNANWGNMNLMANAQITTLGNYPNTSIMLGANTTITPDAAPTSTTSISAAVVTGFVGELTADPVTGVVRVTNAHNANIAPGTYAVMIRAFGPGGTATKTLQLTVTNGTTCTGIANFSDAANVTVGSNPISTAVGDFNNDGQQDIAVANVSANTVSIRLGDGLGSFSGTTNVLVNSGPVSLAVGDV